MLSAAAEELLELLGVSPRLPEPRAFEELFLRFSALVPHESLSRAGAPPLPPEELFAAIVEDGRGSAGGERARAFAALSSALGYDVRLANAEARRAPSARGDAWRPHVAVVARLEGREVLADAAYPIPVLLPLDPPAAEIPTPYGRLSIARRAGEVAVLFDGHGLVEERVRLSARVEGAEPPEPVEPDAPFLLRLQDDRLLFWRAGEMEVSDAWSRLLYVLPPSEAGALRTLFARDDLDAGALSRCEAAPPAAARLDVYDRTELAPAVLFERLASPAAVLALQAPGSVIAEREEDTGGWTWTVLPEPERPGRRERVERRVDGLAIETLSGETPIARRVFRITPVGSGARLALEATLAREVPPLGVGESVRKTLVFHLASELLALSR